MSDAIRAMTSTILAIKNASPTTALQLRDPPSPLPLPPSPSPPPIDHQSCILQTQKPFCQRVCTTNRRPFVVHSHCPSSSETPADEALMCPSSANANSRAPTPLPKWLDSSRDGNATPPPIVRSAEDEAAEGPKLLHRVKHERSILSLAVSEKFVYAGSQSGEILVQFCSFPSLATNSADAEIRSGQ
jgi:hypothetical protein